MWLSSAWCQGLCLGLCPQPGCAPRPPGSWLGLCMEEVPERSFLGSLIPERVAGVGEARGPHPRVLGAAWWRRVLVGKALGL